MNGLKSRSRRLVLAFKVDFGSRVAPWGIPSIVRARRVRSDLVWL